MLLRAIGQTIGPMIKIDEHTNVAIRGRFGLLAVCVDLRKYLIFKVRINNKMQRVKYESLPNICFTYGLYGHTTALCSREEIGMMGNPMDTTTSITKESDLINREGRIDSAAVNHGVNSVAKEGNNEVTVDLSRYVEGTSLKAV
ncbi:hypothetical protein Golax_022153, partial [Gossypium laxum]|nr:hypothetical protein [Gossypium laxum]